MCTIHQIPTSHYLLHTTCTLHTHAHYLANAIHTHTTHSHYTLTHTMYQTPYTLTLHTHTHYAFNAIHTHTHTHQPIYSPVQVGCADVLRAEDVHVAADAAAGGYVCAYVCVRV
jgi:hypothetical protein